MGNSPVMDKTAYAETLLPNSIVLGGGALGRAFRIP